MHKPIFARLFQFRPIFAAYNSPSYKIAKYLVNIVSPLTKICYTLENSASFSKLISSLPNAKRSHLVSLDIENLFTNVPVHEAIQNIQDYFFADSTSFMYMSRPIFKEVLRLTA